MKHWRRRRGALGLMLILATLATAIVLPLGVCLIGFLDGQMLLLRTGEFIDETLPQAYLCLDQDALARGEFSAEASAVEQFIRDRVAANLPSALHGRLEIEDVSLTWQQLEPDPDHWLGGQQPDALPVVHCRVKVTLAYGNPVILTRSVELFQMPV